MRLATLENLLEKLYNFLSLPPDISVLQLDTVHTPNTDITLNTDRIKITHKGALLDLTGVIVTGSPDKDLYIQAFLEDKNQKVKKAILLGDVFESSKMPHGNGNLFVEAGDYIRLDSWGYVTCTIDLVARLSDQQRGQSVWYSEIKSSTEVEPKIRVVTTTNPAAATTGDVGGEISDTAPTGIRRKIKSVKYTLVTSATVANRRSSILVSDPSTLWRITHAVVHAESSGKEYVWTHGYPSVGVEQVVMLSFLPDISLKAGGIFGTSTTTIKMGDDYGAATLGVEDLIEIA